MFTNVIVGVDGCDGGRDAAALAKVLGPSRVALVGAYPADPIRTRASLPGYEELLRQDTLRDLEATKLACAIAAELVAVGDPSPAHVLQRVAQERGADLLVLGSAHHGPFGRALLGDVGRGVMHDAPCPVLVAPKRFAGARPGRIAVGYDGTPEAEAALEMGRRMARELGAALTVYVVREDPRLPVVSTAGLTASMGELVEEARVAAVALLEEALERLPDGTTGEVLHGDAATQLERAAAGHDVLVIGSRGWGAIGRVAIGSTSDRLMHRAPCAVLVVPRPAPAAGGAEAGERERRAAAA